MAGFALLCQRSLPDSSRQVVSGGAVLRIVGDSLRLAGRSRGLMDLSERREVLYRHRTTSIHAPYADRIHIWDISAEDELCQTRDPIPAIRLDQADFGLFN